MCAVSLAAALSAAGAARAQTAYDMTVVNSFGVGEYYGATPQDADIWLLSNFQFDYWNGTEYVTGNSTAGTYGTAVSLENIIDGKVKLYASDGGTRMYAVLSQGTVPPTYADVTSSSATPAPNSYFEWSFSSGNPGTLDLSWIDSWDFATQMQVVANGTQSPAPTTVTYGIKAGVSSATIAANLQAYAGQSKYSWLGTSGFSQTLTYAGATNPVRWITNNSAVTVDASQITSFTNAVDAVITKAAASPAWVAGTPATGPNWTDKGFRVASTQQLTSPDGTVSGNMWSAYVNFTNSGGNYTMTLTDFTIYGGTGTGAAYEVLWNAVTNAGGATYSISEADGMLNAIWVSSPNILSTTPTWVSNLGPDGPNLWYALYNGIASGVIMQDDFVNNTALPTSDPGWTGYVPWVAGQTAYNFEILTAGAAVAGGRNGFLDGSDLVALMQGQATAGTLVNPYFLELLASMQQTPAYLYPSQDFWQAQSIGSDTTIGMQTGPLNGADVFGDAGFTWYLGGAAIPEPSTVLLLGLGGFAAVWGWRRRAAAR